MAGGRMRWWAGVVAAVALVGCTNAPSGPSAGASWHVETADGAGGANGRVDADLGTDSASVQAADGVIHVFTYDASGGNLRHGWFDGTQWRFETLDGAGGINGRVDADVGPFASAALVGGRPVVWYEDVTGGNLRYALWDGGSWQFTTLDGAGGAAGRVDADVGLYTRGAVFEGAPHVFFYDASAGTLRHGWKVGASWQFEILDGAGGPTGRTGNAVGQDLAVVPFAGALHAFYYDGTSGNLRHAWYAGGWSFETLDGASGAAGRRDVDLGQYNAALVHQGELHVFSHDVTNGDLRHEWYAGGAWHFETLDGGSDTGGHTTNVVGTDVTALDVNGRIDAWYSDETGGVLRHAWWSGTAWKFENLDGLGGTGGRVDAVVGEYTTGLVDTAGRAHLWYFADAGDLRHAWLG